MGSDFYQRGGMIYDSEVIIGASRSAMKLEIFANNSTRPLNGKDIREYGRRNWDAIMVDLFQRYNFAFSRDKGFHRTVVDIWHCVVSKEFQQIHTALLKFPYITSGVHGILHLPPESCSSNLLICCSIFSYAMFPCTKLLFPSLFPSVDFLCSDISRSHLSESISLLTLHGTPFCLSWLWTDIV